VNDGGKRNWSDWRKRKRRGKTRRYDGRTRKSTGNVSGYGISKDWGS
jgi:hypothetical protein